MSRGECRVSKVGSEHRGEGAAFTAPMHRCFARKQALESGVAPGTRA